MTYECKQQPVVSSAKATCRAVKGALLPAPNTASKAILASDFAVPSEAKSFGISLQDTLTGNNQPTNSPTRGIISRSFPVLPALAGRKGGHS